MSRAALERGRRGVRAQARAEEHGVAGFFDGLHDKDIRDGDGRYVTHAFLDGHDGVVFVDDRPEGMPTGSEVLGVRPYLAPNPHDTGLAEAARRAGIGASD